MVAEGHGGPQGLPLPADGTGTPRNHPKAKHPTMFLYELAMELDERSPDVAQKAEELGLGTLGSTSELTAEQVQALRAAYRKAAPGAAPDGWGAPESDAAAVAPPVAGPGRSGKAQKLVVVGALVVAVAIGGLVVSKSGPDEDRTQKIASDLDNWDDGVAATVDPSVVAAAQAGVSPDEPSNVADYCAGWQQQQEWAQAVDDMTVEKSWQGVSRRITDEEEAWDEAVHEMKTFGPENLQVAIADYEAAMHYHFDGLRGANTYEEIQTFLAQEDAAALAGATQRVTGPSERICASAE